MSFWDNVKKFAQPYSDDDYDDYDEEMEDLEENTQESAPRGRRPSPFGAQDTDTYSAASTTSTGFSGHVLNMSSGKQEVVLFHAKTFDDVAKKEGRDPEYGECRQGADPPCGRFPVRQCLCTGRQCQEDRSVHLPVLPPQYGCCW